MCSPPLNPKPKHGSTRKRRERARAGESWRASHGKSRAVAVCGIHVKRGRALVTVTHPIDVKRCTPPACAHPLPSVTLERAAQTATLPPRPHTPHHLRPANTPPPPTIFAQPTRRPPPPRPTNTPATIPPTWQNPLFDALPRQHTTRPCPSNTPLALPKQRTPSPPPTLRPPSAPPISLVRHRDGVARGGGEGGQGGRTPPPARRAPGFDQSKGWLSVLN